jgi:hypothetical protein
MKRLPFRQAPSGVEELPISEIDRDYPCYGETANGSLPSPDAVFAIYKAEFDMAFQERTLFILTQHPHVKGHMDPSLRPGQECALLGVLNDVLGGTECERFDG